MPPVTPGFSGQADTPRPIPSLAENAPDPRTASGHDPSTSSGAGADAQNPSRLGALARGIVDGATFGFGDEARGLLDSARGRSSYASSVAASRADLAADAAGNPVFSGAGELLGAAVVPVPALGLAGEAIAGAGIASRVAHAAALGAEKGAIAGGLAGGGHGEGGLEQRVASGFTGAEAGAVLGGALGGAGRSAGAVLGAGERAAVDVAPREILPASPSSEPAALSREASGSAPQGRGQPAAAIDGVGYGNLAWVRVTGGEDIELGANGARSLSVRKSGDAMATLGAWAASDGHDTSAVNLNVRNSLHGSLNHVVADNSFGTWTDKGTVIVAPLAKMVEANGAPATLGTVDTWWTLAPGENLKLAGATFLKAEQPGGPVVPAGEISSRSGNTVTYATGLNEQRERAVLGAMGDHDRSQMVQRIASAMGVEPHEATALIALPRADRDPVAAAAIDGQLKPELKRLATEAVISEIGPVRPGGNWNWTGLGVDNRDTAVMAASLGATAGAHSGGPEEKAIDMIHDGRAAAAAKIDGLSPATVRLASTLDADPRYQAFAQARAVDRELSAEVTNRSGVISAAAAERLAVMVERAERGDAVPAIVVKGHRTSERTSISPHVDTDWVTDPTIARAVRENETMSRLLQTAISSEGPASPIATRLQRAHASVGNALGELELRTDFSSLAHPGDQPVSSQLKRPATAVAYASKPKASRNALGEIVQAMAQPRSATPDPWAPQPIAMGDRIRAMQRVIDREQIAAIAKGTEHTASIHASIAPSPPTPSRSAPSMGPS